MTKAEIIEYLYDNNVRGDLTIEQIAEDLADRKTENSSEKPNNCEAKNYCDDCLYTDTCDSKELFYACTSKATISKMEQVDKDINVRSKDEQTETQNSNENSNVILVYDGVSEAVRCAMCSNPNKSDRGCDGACSYDEKLYERIMKAIAESVAEDEPQTCSVNGRPYDCGNCEYFRCTADEPQTERSE